MARRQTHGLFALSAASCALLWMGVLGGCAGPRLQADTTPPQPAVSLTEAGIHLSILPNTWAGHPSDLGRFYTPVEIKIQNDRADEIQVRFGDFLAVDEIRNQYRAVPPAEVARALLSRGRRYGRPGWPPAIGVASGPPWVAVHDPWFRYPFWPYPPWPPYFWPYHPYGYYDPSFPPEWPRSTAYDILTMGLREGRVLAGARVEGFLYFQQATQKGNSLTLSWTPVAADGKPLTTFSSQFRIIR